LSGAGSDNDRQGRIGLGLAVTLVGLWLAVHIYGVFFYAWGVASVVTAPLLSAFATWLFVGLFIVAHDCMHGSLVPFRPAINRAVGRLCLLLYAAFDFDALNAKHHRHHRHSGTAEDPDFDARPPHGLASWYRKFFTEYFTWRQLALLAALGSVYLYVLGVHPANLVVFWALPAVLSSLQLFYFGTYLPHRPDGGAFADRHRARTNAFGWWLSLLTCFHFGYHHEHHLRPDVPWWRLPRVRAAGQRGERNAI
jgi:beta-carotene ketolase (CrtW type)